MNNGIVIIAHAPLASALRQCVAHVFPERVGGVVAVDVLPDAPVALSVAQARQAIEVLGRAPLLLLTDVLGATPSNVARQLQEGRQARLLAGANLPMVLRAVTYQHEPLEELVARALQGGAQGVLQVKVSETI
ncbi:MAG: PTS fructose transporter subunit IIA [Burkholderiales bacterium]|nr:PTS fructose transporter subunit IIA [Burkholderiales bacterium]